MNTPNVKKCYPFIKLLVGPNTFLAWLRLLGHVEYIFGFSNGFQTCSYLFLKRILRKKIPGCIWLVNVIGSLCIFPAFNNWSQGLVCIRRVYLFEVMAVTLVSFQSVREIWPWFELLSVCLVLFWVLIGSLHWPGAVLACHQLLPVGVRTIMACL